MGFKSKSLSKLIELMIEKHKEVKELDEIASRQVITMKDDAPPSASYNPLADSKRCEAHKDYKAIRHEIDRREKLYEQNKAEE